MPRRSGILLLIALAATSLLLLLTPALALAWTGPPLGTSNTLPAVYWEGEHRVISNVGCRAYINDYPAWCGIGANDDRITAAYVCVRPSSGPAYAAIGFAAVKRSGWIQAHYFWEWRSAAGKDSNIIDLGPLPGSPPGVDTSNAEKYGILESTSGDLNLYINGNVVATIHGLTWTPAECIWGEAQTDKSVFVIGDNSVHEYFSSVQLCNSSRNWLDAITKNQVHDNNNSAASTYFPTGSTDNKFWIWDNR